MIIKEEIRKIMQEVCLKDMSEKSLEDDMDLVNDFGFESVEIMALLAEIEKRFSIDFTHIDLIEGDFTKLGCLCRIIEKAQG